MEYQQFETTLKTIDQTHQITLRDEMLNDKEIQDLINQLTHKIGQYTNRITKTEQKVFNDQQKNQIDPITLELPLHIEMLRKHSTFFKYLGSGIGNGAYVEMINGDIKLDFLTGIGVFFDGHSNLNSIKENLYSALVDTTMQSNIQFNREYGLLLNKLIELASKKSSLRHGFLSLTGSMVNEMALKIIRQKRFPAYKMLAFEDCFAGRTVMMSEITDSASKREQQKSYSEVLYLPFFDQRDPQGSTQKALDVLDSHLNRYGSDIAGLVVELVQGEGGFRKAPTSFFKAIFEKCKKHQILIWDDEVQTFGRTGELFAYETFELGQYIDLVTIGKMLQSCALLWTPDVAPKEGLVAGTFVGSTVSLNQGYSILNRLIEGNYLGEQGKINRLGQYFQQQLEALVLSIGEDYLKNPSALGGMISVQVFDGELKKTTTFLRHLYKNGLIAFYCGHGPYKLRFLPPMLVLTKQHIDEAIEILKTSLLSIRFS